MNEQLVDFWNFLKINVILSVVQPAFRMLQHFNLTVVSKHTCLFIKSHFIKVQITTCSAKMKLHSREEATVLN